METLPDSPDVLEFVAPPIIWQAKFDRVWGAMINFASCDIAELVRVFKGEDAIWDIRAIAMTRKMENRGHELIIRMRTDGADGKAIRDAIARSETDEWDQAFANKWRFERARHGYAYAMGQPIGLRFVCESE